MKKGIGMEYKNILNKDLRIAGIHIAELTEEYKNIFDREYGSHKNLQRLTRFYDSNSDYLVINLDYPGHKDCMDIAEKYLTMTKSERADVCAFMDRLGKTSLCGILNCCMYAREGRRNDDQG